jgi:hypothetical protein
VPGASPASAPGPETSAASELIVPDEARAAPQAQKAPDPQPALSPAPHGLIHFSVVRVGWQRADAGTTCSVDADAGPWAAAASGTLSLTVRDTSLDHLRVGDVLTLHADPRGDV